MNRVESIEIFTESSYGWFVAEYLKSKTLYNIRYIGGVPDSEVYQKKYTDDDKNYKNLKRTILLIDVTIPDLLECLERKPLLTSFFSTAGFNCERGDPVCIFLIKHGVKGIFYSDEELEAIEKGIILLAQNKVRTSRRLLYRAACAKEGELYKESLNGKLTQREVEIFFLVKEGFTNREIAEKLYISLYTVKKHISNIFRKIKIDKRVDIRKWDYQKMKEA